MKFLSPKESGPIIVSKIAQLRTLEESEDSKFTLPKLVEARKNDNEEDQSNPPTERSLNNALSNADPM